jgi:hypothetical protein
MISPCLTMRLAGNLPRILGGDLEGNRPISRSNSDTSDGGGDAKQGRRRLRFLMSDSNWRHRSLHGAGVSCTNCARKNSAAGISRPSRRRTRYGSPVVDEKDAAFAMKSSAEQISASRLRHLPRRN